MEFRAVTRKINVATGARLVSIDDLERWMADGTDFLLLDVREKEETVVSRLPGAWPLPPREIARTTLDPSADTRIVTYCTVGERSGRAAVELEKRLGRPVYGLDGGIIAWVNGGKAVVDPSGRETAEVHPYEKDWARFLRPRQIP